MLIEAGVLEFHPEDQRPRVECPKCLAGGHKRPTDLYWIRGINDADHDDGIPKALFSVSKLTAVNELDADTRALRVQLEGAIRNCIATQRHYQELQQQQKELFALLKDQTKKLEQRSSSTRDPSERDPDLPPLMRRANGSTIEDGLSPRPRPPLIPAPPPAPPRTDRFIHRPPSQHRMFSQPMEYELDHTAPARTTMTAGARSSAQRPYPAPYSAQPNAPQRSLKRKRSPGSFVLSVLTDEPPPPSTPVRSTFAPPAFHSTAPSPTPAYSVPPPPSPSRFAPRPQQYHPPSFLGTVPNSSQALARSHAQRSPRATGRQSRHFQAPTHDVAPPPTRSPPRIVYPSPTEFEFPATQQQPHFLPHEPWFSPVSDSRQHRVDAGRAYETRASESREHMPPPPTPSWRRPADSGMAFSQPRVRSQIGAREMGMAGPLNAGWHGRGSWGMEGRAY